MIRTVKFSNWEAFKSAQGSRWMRCKMFVRAIKPSGFWVQIVTPASVHRVK